MRLAISPGESREVKLGTDLLIIAIPAGEGYSIGTLTISRNGATITTCERDGMPESLHVDDITGDGKPDLVIVNRSAGSGGYVEIWLCESKPSGFSARRLPELPVNLLKGYGGHDVVGIVDGRVTRLHPLYAKHLELTLSLKSFPLQLVPDSNAAPSGGQQSVYYDTETDQWIASH